ncbi:restriction endonuclease subunit S [Hydrogenovibrio kuenenii]|uniref:restriction endonuclease subunit S n=1 Tax=Hydrogenovibrio kuenenii TaxID=63658 RepID=UPI00046649BF|nr:restriction endonuclease subunit S [Hydrogenovibrio kuenenii]
MTTINISEIAEFISGIAFGKVKQLNVPLSVAHTETVTKLIRPQDLPKSGLLNAEHLHTIPTVELNGEQHNQIQSHHLIRSNDILVVSKGSSFRSAIVKELETDVRFVINNNLIVIRPNEVPADFLSLMLNTRWFYENYIAPHQKDQLSVSIKQLKETQLVEPNLEQKLHFEEVLETYHNELDALDKLQLAAKAHVDSYLLEAIFENNG